MPRGTRSGGSVGRSWSRVALGLAALVSVTNAASSRVFFASAVSYCSQERAIEVEKFLLSYDVDTSSISFDISASQAASNLNPILSFELTAYGIEAVNVSLNLCDQLGGVLCPLPTYNFVGSATIPIPTSLTDGIDIPGIAFVIPDLEATAIVRLTRVEDLTEAACLRVQLSNGLTTRHGYVSWALGGIALLSLVVAVVGALVSIWKRRDVERGRSKERFVNIFFFYQFVVSTALLDLRYPIVFTSYAANFAWTFGLIRMRPIQTAIDSTRAKTGGNLTQVADLIVGGTAALQRNLIQLPFDEETTFSSALKHIATHAVPHLSKRATTGDVPTVSQVDTTALPFGIPRYLTDLDVSSFNAFMTVFLTFLLFLCLFVAASIVLGGLYALVAVWQRRKRGEAGHGTVLLNLIRANALRVLLISWFPLLTFIFYQWTLGKQDSWAPIVLAVFTFIFTTGSIAFISVRTILLGSRHRGAELLHVGGGPSAPLWNSLKRSRWWFFAILLVATFVRAVFVGAGINNGWVQTIGLAAVEVIVFVLACIFTPFADRSLNGVQITIMILRIIISGALIVFNDGINIGEIPRTAIGIVIIVIESVVVVGFFLLVLIDAGAVILRIFRKQKPLDSSEYPSAVTTNNKTDKLAPNALGASNSDDRTLNDDTGRSKRFRLFRKSTPNATRID